MLSHILRPRAEVGAVLLSHVQGTKRVQNPPGRALGEGLRSLDLNDGQLQVVSGVLPFRPVLSFPCRNHCKALRRALAPPASKGTETMSCPQWTSESPGEKQRGKEKAEALVSE